MVILFFEHNYVCTLKKSEIRHEPYFYNIYVCMHKVNIPTYLKARWCLLYSTIISFDENQMYSEILMTPTFFELTDVILNLVKVVTLSVSFVCERNWNNFFSLTLKDAYFNWINCSLLCTSRAPWGCLYYFWYV